MASGQLFAGVDAGSRAIKVVIYDPSSGEIAAAAAADQGVNCAKIARDLFDAALEKRAAARSKIGGIAATGYGRNAIDFADATVTEITCHARGVFHLLPGTRTVIEIGGQDSKVLVLDGDGSVRDFAMNDRCAAGTGRFLEVVADRLGIPLQSLGDAAARSANPAAISSTCIVFAETEIIGLLAHGTPPEDIVAGVQNSVAARVAGLVGARITPPVAFTGGVALVDGMRRALEMFVGQPVAIPPHPQFTGALGAAIVAAQRSSRTHC